MKRVPHPACAGCGTLFIRPEGVWGASCPHCLLSPYAAGVAGDALVVTGLEGPGLGKPDCTGRNTKRACAALPLDQLMGAMLHSMFWAEAKRWFTCAGVHGV